MFARSTSRDVGYGDLFTDWELAIAKKLARQAIKRFSSLESQFDKDDLIQEVLIHWHRVRGTYRQDRGASPGTFMQKVCWNRIRELARRESAGVRKINSAATPFSWPVNSSDRTVEEEANNTASQVGPREDFELLERLEEARSRLTARQRKILEMYQDESIAAVARELDVARETVYVEIRRIRNSFEDEGLEDFIK